MRTLEDSNLAHPNQWHTPVRVSIHRLTDDTLVFSQMFSDIQMAWLYVKGRVGSRPRSPNYLSPFERTIQRLGEAHADGARGYICAEKDGHEYVVFYEVRRDTRDQPN